MPAKIKELSPSQTAMLGEWAKKWIAIGLSTEPADFDAATKAALRAYALCNLKRPMAVLHMSSPYGVTVGGAIAWMVLHKFFGTSVQSQVQSQVEAQVWSQVWSRVQSQVQSQVRSQVEAQVEAQVWSQVQSQVQSQVRSQVWSQVEAQVRSQVQSQVRSQVEAQVEHVRSHVQSGFRNVRGGAFWASWCAYVSFYRDVMGWADPVLERFEIDEILARSCGWVWWHENVLAISDRPCVLNRDNLGRLHCESGPSIAYRDGWQLHHVHGVAVPDYVIYAPEKIKTETIDSERNIEVRRIMIERYGQERYLLGSGCELLCRDRYGELYRKSLAGDEPLVMVKVKNSTPEPDGSIKDYFLRVPPTTQTPHEAVAWTFGANTKEYAPDIET